MITITQLHSLTKGEAIFLHEKYKDTPAIVITDIQDIMANKNVPASHNTRVGLAKSCSAF